MKIFATVFALCVAGCAGASHKHDTATTEAEKTAPAPEKTTHAKHAGDAAKSHEEKHKEWQRNVALVQEKMRTLEWMVGDWEGTTQMHGQEMKFKSWAKWTLDKTAIHTKSKIVGSDGATIHEDATITTFDPKQGEYVIHFFMAAYHSTSVMKLGADGKSFEWSEMHKKDDRVRGRFTKINKNEWEEVVEFEEEPGKFMPGVQTKAKRVEE